MGGLAYSRPAVFRSNLAPHGAARGGSRLSDGNDQETASEEPSGTGRPVMVLRPLSEFLPCFQGYFHMGEILSV